MNWKKSWESFHTIRFSDVASKPVFRKVTTFVQGKAFLSALMVLLLGGAIGFHAWWTNKQDLAASTVLDNTKPTLEQSENDTDLQAPVSVSQGVFDAFHLQREDTRAQEVEYLQDILQDERTDEATRTTAQLQLSRLSDSMEKELTIETLVQAKGFERVIALSHEDSLNIVVGAQSLSEDQVAQILSIAVQESGKSADQIKIIPSVVE